MPWGRHQGGYLPGLAGGGVPCQVQLGGVPCQVQPGGEGTLPGPAGGGGYPARSSQGRGVPCQGALVRYPPSQVRMGGYPGRDPPPLPPAGYPPSQDGGVGGTQVGQQKEYLIHGGRYASCVHAGGLSC